MKKNNHWQPTTAAAKLLDISPAHLRRLRDTGYLKKGVHYRDISAPTSRRSYWQWNTAKIGKLLNV